MVWDSHLFQNFPQFIVIYTVKGFGIVRLLVYLSIWLFWFEEDMVVPVHSHCCCLVASLCLTLCDPWTVAHQAPLSMEFARQEYWSGLPLPFPGDLPDPGIEPEAPTASPALQMDSLSLSHWGSPVYSRN